MDQTGRILYNPAFFARLSRLDPTGLLIVGVLAHELGHIAHDHLAKPLENPHEHELEADSTAGCVLGKLCKSSEQFENLLRVLSDEFGTPSHPPGPERTEAVRAGWRECAQHCEPRARSSGPGIGEVIGGLAIGALFGVGISALAGAFKE